MIGVREALQLVGKHVRTLPAIDLGCLEALGRIIAEEVVSPRDSPQFDKALMDGFAIRSQDARQVGVTLQVVESVAAGGVPQAKLGPGEAIRIMTGAPVPTGADVVIPWELTREIPPEEHSYGWPGVRIEAILPPEKNILRRGGITQAGQLVLPRGTRITPARLAWLLELGVKQVRVIPPVRVSVLATGSELVEPGADLAAGQIWNSNGPMICGLLREIDSDVCYLGIAADDDAILRQKIKQGLESDLLLITGGVSSGDFDLVPKLLTELEVQPVFHRIRMKPGKPLWFGISRTSGVVFGLPGNPLSVFVGFRVFVEPTLRVLGGDAPTVTLVTHRRPMADAFQTEADREVFWPARLRDGGHVELLPWRGSADLATLASAQALAWIPPGSHQFRVGDLLDILPIDR